MNATATLTQIHRNQQILLSRSTVAQMNKIWPALDWARLDKTYPAFAVQVSALVKANQRTSQGLASQYMSAFRKVSGIPGSVRTALPNPFNADQFAVALRVNSVVAAKNSASESVDGVIAMENAFVLASGAMSELVLDAGRGVILGTISEDKRAVGWQRVGGGNTCGFCSMLIGRGAVYGKAGAFFSSHAHCTCTAEPVYEGGSTGPGQAVNDYTQSSTRSLIPDDPNLSNADRLKISRQNASTTAAADNRAAGARAWMKANPNSN